MEFLLLYLSLRYGVAMIISWITSKGASMGKLDDALEQKLLDFCINHSVKPLNEVELKQYIPIQFIPIKQQEQLRPNNATLDARINVQSPKKKWWKR